MLYLQWGQVHQEGNDVTYASKIQKENKLN